MITGFCHSVNKIFALLGF